MYLRQTQPHIEIDANGCESTSYSVITRYSNPSQAGRYPSTILFAANDKIASRTAPPKI